MQSHSPGDATFPACWRSHCSQQTRALQRVACGYDVGKISACCPVISYILYCILYCIIMCRKVCCILCIIIIIIIIIIMLDRSSSYIKVIESMSRSQQQKQHVCVSIVLFVGVLPLTEKQCCYKNVLRDDDEKCAAVEI